MLRRAGWLVPTALAQSPRLQAHLELTRCLILIPPWPSIYPDPLPLAQHPQPLISYPSNPYPNCSCRSPPRRFLLALRDALALAHALNRTLVLPAPHCLCDRFDSSPSFTPLPSSLFSPLTAPVPIPQYPPLSPSSLAPPNSLLKSSPRRAFASVTGRLLPKP